MKASTATRQYFVVIEQIQGENTIQRPMVDATRPSAFPAGARTRLQARKLLTAVRRQWPSASIVFHQAL